MHLGTTHHVAHVALLEGDTLTAGNRARVQLAFDTPVSAVPGDRFIVRNAQATRTVGGGRVLDPFGPARKRRAPARRAWLDALTAWLDEARVEPLFEQSPRGMLRSMLMHLTGLPAQAIALPAAAIMVPLPGKAADDAIVVTRTHWERMRAQIVDALQNFHTRSPDEPGADAARLRRIAAPLLPYALWRALIDSMVAEGAITRSGPWLHLPDHTVTLDANEEALAQLLMPRVAQGRFDPPWVRDLASAVNESEDRVRPLMRKLARQGDVYQVVRDLFYHRDVVRELAGLIAGLAQQHGGVVGASAFRDATGLGRKRAIQILEFFDRVGYTRFQRDVHLLRTDSHLHDVL